MDCAERGSEVNPYDPLSERDVVLLLALYELVGHPLAPITLGEVSSAIQKAKRALEISGGRKMDDGPFYITAEVTCKSCEVVFKTQIESSGEKKNLRNANAVAAAHRELSPACETPDLHVDERPQSQ